VKTKEQDSATTRACRAWQTKAVVIRGDLRAQGVHGDLRTLDEIAAGRRGTSVPTQLTKLAMEMRDHGMSEAAVTLRLTRIAAVIAAIVFNGQAA